MVLNLSICMPLRHTPQYFIEAQDDDDDDDEFCDISINNVV